MQKIVRARAVTSSVVAVMIVSLERLCYNDGSRGASASVIECERLREMAGSLNKVMVIGNVGRDPEMRYTSNGQAVVTFSVAASRRWRDQDGQDKEETEWFNVVAWQKLAETVNQIVTKGRKVYVEGRLQTRSWDGQDGQKHYRTEVVASTVMMIDRRPDAPTSAPAATHAATNGTAASSPWGDLDEPAPDLNDIPF